MNFDDRLRHHLQNQNEMIEIDSEGPAAVADRHARRSRNRMAASACAVALVVVGGITAWTQSNQPFEQETTIAAPAEETDDTATDDTTTDDSATDDTATDDTTDADTGRADGDAVTTTVSVEAIERVDPGAPDSVWNFKADGDVYYVLSTAPGETGLDDNGDIDPDFNYRANTIYRFDEATGWSNADVTDRWISDFTPSNGVLYVLSTGRTDGSVDPAVGVSADQGATWDWQSVPDLAAIAGDTVDGFSPTTLRLVPVGDRQFLFAQNLGFPDWLQAIDLARSAGVDITDTAQVVNVTEGAISYFPPAEADPQQECWDIRREFNEASNEIWQEFDGLYEDNDTEIDFVALEAEINARVETIAPAFEARLVEAGCVNEIECERISRGYWMIGQDLWQDLGPDSEPSPEVIRDIDRQLTALREAEAPTFEAQLEAAGCDNFIECERISSGVDARFADERAELDSAYANYDNLSEEEIEVLSSREQALWSTIEAERQTALEATDCWSDEDYIDGPENVTTVTWAELGVTPPASWSASSEYYEFRDGGLAPLGAAPFDGEIVINISSGPEGTEVLSLDTEAYFGYEGAQSATVWTTGDGATWVRSGTSDHLHGLGGSGPVTVGDVSLLINWGDAQDGRALDFPPAPSGAEILITDGGEPYFIDESGAEVLVPLPVIGPTSTLERSVAGGAWEPIDIGALAPELSGQSVYIDNLFDTAIGVVIVAQTISSDLSNPSSSPAIVLHSADGETWQTVTLDADWVSAVSAGDSVLLLGSKNTPRGEARATPATVLLRPAR